VRILLLADNLANGGLQRQLALLATNLPQEWETRIIAMDGGPYEVHLRRLGVQVTVMKRRFRRDLRPALALGREIRRWKPNLVHAWGWMTASAAAPTCRRLWIPLVNGVIRDAAPQGRYGWLKRVGMSMSTLIVANSWAGLRAWDIGSEKGRVVYNGFDASRLKATRRPHVTDYAPFTVVMTARMSPQKDYDVVIQAARHLSQRESDWLFVLLGDGSERRRLMHVALDLTERGVVAFPDPRSEVLDVVRDASIGVLMTNPMQHQEGLSNSIMEYMALGLPVVCGEGGGNPELVIDGVTGFLVPQTDAVTLADRLAYLRTHPDVAARMGAAGRARVLGELSVDAMVHAWTTVYSEASQLTMAHPRAQGRPKLRG